MDRLDEGVGHARTTVAHATSPNLGVGLGVLLLPTLDVRVRALGVQASPLGRSRAIGVSVALVLTTLVLPDLVGVRGTPPCRRCTRLLAVLLAVLLELEVVVLGPL